MVWPKNGSGSSACKRTRPKTRIAKWFHCLAPLRPPDSGPLHQRPRPAGHRGPCARKFDGAGWARLPLIGERHIARFATIGAVIEAIGTEPNVVLALADRAVLFANARFLGLIALCANHPLVVGSHSASEGNFNLSGGPPARAWARAAPEKPR